MEKSKKRRTYKKNLLKDTVILIFSLKIYEKDKELYLENITIFLKKKMNLKIWLNIAKKLEQM